MRTARRAGGPPFARLALLHLLLLAGTAGAAACPVPGRRVQWIADHCMFEASTDDVVAVSDCIERELAASRHLRTCDALKHYKAALCRGVVRSGAYRGTVPQCVADRGFHGKTVEQAPTDAPRAAPPRR